MRYQYLDVVVEFDVKSGTTMGLSSLSKTKPSGGREEELRYPHLDVVVELDVKSGTTMGLAPLSKTNPGGRKVEFMVLLCELESVLAITAGIPFP